MLAIVVVVGAIIAVNSDKTRTLRIFIWEEYIDPQVYSVFEREFGAKVIEDNYGSNEDMRAKLQAGGAVYDLVVPSDYMVRLLRQDGLLLPIDLSHIPNLTHLATRFRDPPYDPGHAYSVPYQWGDYGHRLQPETGASAAGRGGPTCLSRRRSNPTNIGSACSTICARSSAPP